MKDPVVEAFLKRHPTYNARITTTGWQKWWFLSFAVLVVAVALWDTRAFAATAHLALAAFFMVGILYRVLAVTVGALYPGEERIPPEKLAACSDAELPIYTLLIPMYREAAVVPGLMDALEALDYPKDKLDIIFLLETDDRETQAAMQQARRPPGSTVMVVPEGQPQMKPRACNHGLAIAKGQYLVIFDAEDRPDPDQVKKAAIAFSEVGPDVACLQAKLNYYNPRQTWLTRCFTLEYTTWFDIVLCGLTRMNVPIPLGGTSNHFRTAVLQEVGGWDPFNVTEDADLGIRLYAEGYRTRVLDATTWEEAPSEVWAWIRQRTRWVKGHLQTHLVHTRTRIGWTMKTLAAVATIALAVALGGILARQGAPSALVPTALVLAASGLGGFAAVSFATRTRERSLYGEASFVLTLAAGVITMLLHLFIWAIWFLWALPYWSSWFSAPWAAMEPWVVPTQWTAQLWVVGVFLFVAYVLLAAVHLLGCWKRGFWYLAPWTLLIPVYWMVMSAGAYRAFWHLLTRPHYWGKTVHGLATEEVPGTVLQQVRARPAPVVLALGMVVALLATAPMLLDRIRPADAFNHFVVRSADVLLDGDRPLRFASFNVPALIVDDTEDLRAPDPWVQEDAFATVARAGIPVVRLYTLSVGGPSEPGHRHVTGPGTFDEEMFVALDRVLLLAHQYRVRVILPLVDQWSYWGGIEEYAAFRGKTAEAFWTDPQLIADFEETLSFVVNRTNTLTGVRYRDDPAILAWETGNELFAPDTWTARIAAKLKEMDPNHLVMDGHYGISAASVANPDIDIVSNHYYPAEGQNFAARLARDLETAQGRKVFLVGEFGGADAPIVEDFLEAFAASHAAGVLLWRFEPRWPAGGYRIRHREQLEDGISRAYRWPGCPSGDPWEEREIVALMQGAAKAVRPLPLPTPAPPAPPTLLQADDPCALVWRGTAGASHYRFERAEQRSGPWTVVGEGVSECDTAAYCDRSGEPDVPYYYRVRAMGAAGLSDPSNVLRVGPE